MAKRKYYSSRYRATRSFRRRDGGRINRKVVLFLSLLALLIVLGLANSREIGRLVSQRVERQDYSPMVELLDQTVDTTFVDLGVPANSIDREVHKERRGRNSWEVIEKKVGIPADLPLELCNLELTRAVEKAGGKVFQAIEGPKGKSVSMDLGFGDIITQELFLAREDSLWRKTGKIAIIVDDLGANEDEVVWGLLNIEQPLTFSILPGLKFSKEIADLAQQRGQEVMLHLPMEPYGYPKEDPGSEAIFVKLSQKEIQRRTHQALDSVPHVKGVNNHMGSKATEDSRVMRNVLKELESKGLYFVDSRTSSKSVAYELAQRMRVKAAEVQVPLDNEPRYDLIREKVEEMVQVAVAEGGVVVRGHVQYPQTLQVLKEVLPALEKKGFEFVHASQLVE